MAFVLALFLSVFKHAKLHRYNYLKAILIFIGLAVILILFDSLVTAVINYHVLMNPSPVLQ